VGGGGSMVEKRELIEGETMELRGAITDACPRCSKITYHNVEFNDPKRRIPHELAMVRASNLDVVMFERIVPTQVEFKNEETGEIETRTDNHSFYVYFKCEDPMCLLSHLRETMMFNWVQNEKLRYKNEFDQAMMKAKADRHRRQPSRRANRRNKAKKAVAKTD
jgi:hypothetical protein